MPRSQGHEDTKQGPTHVKVVELDNVHPILDADLSAQAYLPHLVACM